MGNTVLMEKALRSISDDFDKLLGEQERTRDELIQSLSRLQMQKDN